MGKALSKESKTNSNGKESTLQFLNELWETLLPFLVPIFLFILGWNFVKSAPVHYGEGHIIGPVIKHLKGEPYPALIYPSFPYLFYEYAFKFGKLFNSNLEIFEYSRALNTLLMGVNAYLFFLILRIFNGPYWSLLGAFLLGLSPGFFYSGVVVKTEPLLILEFFLLVLVLNKWRLNPNNLGPFILGGVISGLGLSTKYNPAYFLTFFYFVFMKGRLYFSLRHLKGRNFWIFFLSMTITVLITWINLWPLLQFLISSQSQNDIYFNDFPTTARAIPEWFSFPYGRYSYAFLITIPFALGLFNYGFGLFGIIRKKVPSFYLKTLGVFTCIYLFLILNFTLLRIPHLFSLCVPIIILGTLGFLKILFQKSTRVGAIFSFSAISISLLQYKNVATPIHEVVNLEKRVISQMRSRNVLYLANSAHNRRVGLRGDRVLSHIEKENPRFILANENFLMNYCHYKKSFIYIQHCSFFKNLLNGKGNYQKTWEREVAFKMKPFSFLIPHDPYRYIMLERKDL